MGAKTGLRPGSPAERRRKVPAWGRSMRSERPGRDEAGRDLHEALAALLGTAIPASVRKPVRVDSTMPTFP